MFNPNRAPQKSNLESMESVQDELTPRPETFKDGVYPATEVDQDLKQLSDRHETPEYQDKDERDYPILLERTFRDSAEKDDWFCEGELYADEEDYDPFVTIPAAEIDDEFGHIDVICLIKNSATGNEALPFAVDLTTSTDFDNMSQKFGHKHVYGKRPNAPQRASEFGYSWVSKRDGAMRTRPLEEEYRYGLKLPGFAAAKYAEDTDMPDEPRIPKGRIKMMPRFIVGYPDDLSDILAKGPAPLDLRDRDINAFKAWQQDRRDALASAQWCVLLECKQQADDISSMLDTLDNRQLAQIDPSELATAKKQIAAMVKYFDNAIKQATKATEADPRKKAAKGYAEDLKRRRTVVDAITTQSFITYRSNRHSS